MTPGVSPPSDWLDIMVMVRKLPIAEGVVILAVPVSGSDAEKRGPRRDHGQAANRMPHIKTDVSRVTDARY